MNVSYRMVSTYAKSAHFPVCHTVHKINQEETQDPAPRPLGCVTCVSNSTSLEISLLAYKMGRTRVSLGGFEKREL